jgi:FG-GAP-like repeat
VRNLDRIWVVLLLLCAAQSSSRPLYAQASGPGFTAGSFRTIPWPSQAGQLADINGDGRADLAYAAGPGMYVRYSTGTGFGSAVQVGAVPVVGTAWSEQQGNQDVHASFLTGDVDGNGRADIVFSNGTALLSTSGGFKTVPWPGFAAGQLADVNGDRKADLVYAAGSAMYVRYSSGTGFGSAVHVGTIPVVGTAWSEQQGNQDVHASFLAGDVDGNGRADIVFSNGTALLSTAQASNR